MSIKKMLLLCAAIMCAASVKAQDNFEIQVYASPTVGADSNMIELHSNYSFKGSRVTDNGVLPTRHVLHETVEVTHGFGSCFEIGFYFFNTIGDNNRTGYVGSHIRPRIAAPAKWHLPVGLSLSTEVGFQGRQYCEDDWTWEIRPIIDKTMGRFYWAINPAIDKSLHGLNMRSGFSFAPNVKMSFAVHKKCNIGIEYYGSLGPFGNFLPWGKQDQQIFIVADLDISPVWEINFGYGVGLTDQPDKSIFKLIAGRKVAGPWRKGSGTVPNTPK